MNNKQSPGMFRSIISLLGMAFALLGIEERVFGAIPASERAALIALYNSTKGDNWKYNEGWKEPFPAADGFALPGSEGDWYGITVDGGNTTVLSIGLYYNHLDGPLPSEIGNLTNLKNLWLRSNSIRSIPPELGNLGNLETLYIDNIDLSYIPPELGNLGKLRILDLDNNNLSSLPVELGNLVNLHSLYLSGNNLTSIPRELGNLHTLRWLLLSDNDLTDIPPQLGNLANLRILTLDRNILASIPPELGRLGNLTVLSLTENNLTFIPPELGNLDNLIELCLDKNNLTVLPPELGSSKLYYLTIAENNLSVIPPELGGMINLNHLSLEKNNLTRLPAELGNLDNLQVLYLAENNLTGIPPELGNLGVLYILDLGKNAITRIPPELGNLAGLRYFNLSFNALGGGIPPELGNLSSLRILDLSFNALGGNIPPELGNLDKLYKLSLSENNLRGGIPPELGNMINMKYLYLDHNELTGRIPAELGYLPNLVILDLHANRLGGEIPADLLNMNFPGDVWNPSWGGLNICWNALYTSNSTLREFLDLYSTCGWETTQTVDPRRITASAVSPGAIKLEWKPIPYRVDSGGYRVYYSTSKKGPFQYYGMTGDKFATTMTVSGLNPDTTYYFRMQTRTLPHEDNDNAVDSEMSGIVSAVTEQRACALSGTVSYRDSGLAGVTLHLSNDGGTVVTGDQGNYYIQVEPGWSGTVTPVKGYYRFTPTSRSYSPVYSERFDQDFSAFLPVSLSLRAERKTEEAFIIRRDYGFLSLEVANNGDIPGLRCVIERKAGNGAFQVIHEITTIETANRAFTYIDQYLKTSEPYTYRAILYDGTGQVLVLTPGQTI